MTTTVSDWLTEENRKCQQLTSEKVQEFQQTVNVHRLWLETYIDQLLQKSGSQELSSLLKTPATTKSKRKADDDLVDSSKVKVANTAASTSSDISSFMQRIKDRIASTANVSSHSHLDSKSFSVTIPEKPVANISVKNTSSADVSKSEKVSLEKPIVDISRYHQQAEDMSFADNSIMEHVLISELSEAPVKKQVIVHVKPKEPVASSVIAAKPALLNLTTKPVKIASAPTTTSSNVDKNGNSSKLPLPNKFKITPSSSAATLKSTYQFKKPVAVPSSSTSNAVKLKINVPTSSQKPVTTSSEDEARRLKLANMQKSIDNAKAVTKPPTSSATAVKSSTTEIKQNNSSENNSHQSIAKILANEEVVIPEILTDEESSDDDSEQQQYVNNKFNLPEWARSPNLKQSLRNQIKVNPDTIFGSFSILKLEDIFQGSSLKRFRVRSSSANWSKDKLTEAEAKRYDNFMGYHNNNNL